MPFPYYKTPDEIETPSVNFFNRLGSGDEVASGVAKIYDEAGTDVSSTMVVGAVTISDEDADGTDETATVKVKAGTHGNNYRLDVIATTVAGHKKQEDVWIYVRESSIT